MGQDYIEATKEDIEVLKAGDNESWDTPGWEVSIVHWQKLLSRRQFEDVNGNM